MHMRARSGREIMENGGSNKGVVLVTGGTGFIGSWMIMRLLEQGYAVRTTVRSKPDHKRNLTFLTSLPGASERLHIFEADLDHPESFRASISGCTGVFHVAHAIDITGKEPEEVATNRAVNATLGILRACLESGSVKRVVYTSGATTVMFNGVDGEGSVVDEQSWSNLEYYRSLRAFGSSLLAAKMTTEKVALEFAAENGLDLVTVIPSLVLGPFICPHTPTSVLFALSMIFGKRERYNFLMKTSMVHIDDVVKSHIFLLTHPEAKGRYICSSNQLTLLEMSEFLAAKYPQYPIPTKEDLEVEGYMSCGLSSKKLLDCGFKYEYGRDDMFDGAIRSCKLRGLLENTSSREIGDSMVLVSESDR